MTEHQQELHRLRTYLQRKIGTVSPEVDQRAIRAHQALDWGLAEIERLTAALHRARVHPDYTYLIVKTDQESKWGPVLRDWEPNPEYAAAPGDQCWRRRKDPT